MERRAIALMMARLARHQQTNIPQASGEVNPDPPTGSCDGILFITTCARILVRHIQKPDLMAIGRDARHIGQVNAGCTRSLRAVRQIA
jgi:hypothetical protein